MTLPQDSLSAPTSDKKRNPCFVVGLDLGQSMDYTALVVGERVTPGKNASYHIRHIERFALKTPYPDIIRRVYTLFMMAPLHGQSYLAVDATGVGLPVMDMLRSAKLIPVGITITGGQQIHRDGPDWSVPKRDLVSTVQVLLQSHRLQVAKELPLASLLVQELLNFRVKISDTAHDTYGVWREGMHDDLVLAVALACWYGEHVGDKRLGLWW